MIRKILSILLTAAVATACFEDKGNYNYHEIDRVTISGIDELYPKTAYVDVLTIEPEIRSVINASTYSFLWTIHKELTTSWGDYSSIKTDTIGTERILNYPVNRKSGRYTVILRVTNNESGLETYHTTTLEVTTQFSRGFYLLKDKQGATDLDIHLPGGEVIGDVLELSLGSPILEKPISLGLNPVYSYVNEKAAYEVASVLTLCTEQDVRILKIEDMSVIYDHVSMFFGEVPSDRPAYASFNTFGMLYMSSEGCFFSMQAPEWGMYGAGKFGYPAIVDDNGPDMGCSPNGNALNAASSFFFFDEKNGRFLQCDFNGGMHIYSDLNASNQPMPYNPNGITYKLKYLGLERITTAHYGYAVFEDPTLPGKHYLYNIYLSGWDYSNPILSVTTVPSGSLLNQATIMATNELTVRVIYFVTGNKLYMYDCSTNSEELLNLSGTAADEEITFVKNLYWTYSKEQAEYRMDHLVVATYKAGHYKVYLYNMTGGKPNGAPVKLLEGDGGRIRQVQYISPRMDSSTDMYYPLSNISF